MTLCFGGAYLGYQGYQGYQGFQGFQGFQGYQGFSGFQGYQGYSGYSECKQYSAAEYSIDAVSPHDITLNTSYEDSNNTIWNDGDFVCVGYQDTVGAGGKTRQSDSSVSYAGLEVRFLDEGAGGGGNTSWPAIDDGQPITVCLGTCNEGYQGFQGYSGHQGYQGYQGFQGNQGFQGYQGYSGGGPQGYQGYQGNQGDQGNQGAGYQGVPGAQGAQGAAGGGGGGGGGAQGFQGFQGNQGNQGAAGGGGSAGTQGFQGFQGAQGARGSQLVVDGINDYNLLYAVTSGTTTVASGCDHFYVDGGHAGGGAPDLFLRGDSSASDSIGFHATDTGVSPNVAADFVVNKDNGGYGWAGTSTNYPFYVYENADVGTNYIVLSG